jgi:hypothetical protein
MNDDARNHEREDEYLEYNRPMMHGHRLSIR